MNKEQLRFMENWFRRYSMLFQKDNQLSFAMEMKIDHTKRVVNEIVSVAESLGLTTSEVNLAKAIALLHDVGRLEQFSSHNTLSDLKSVDHADLGVKILKEERLLEIINIDEREIILKSIELHNKKYLPHNLSERVQFFCRLLRDADRLDIINVIIKYDLEGSDEEKQTALLSLPESKGVDEKILSSLENRKLANVADLSNRNDYRMFVLAWFYDFSFFTAKQEAIKRNYIDKLSTNLTKTERVENILTDIKNYLNLPNTPE